MAVCVADMIIKENTCIEGIERRGRVYYMRWRVPARFSEIEKRSEINKSLRTRDYDEAKVRFVVEKGGSSRSGKPALFGKSAKTHQRRSTLP